MSGQVSIFIQLTRAPATTFGAPNCTRQVQHFTKYNRRGNTTKQAQYHELKKVCFNQLDTTMSFEKNFHQISRNSITSKRVTSLRRLSPQHCIVSKKLNVT